MPRDFSWQNTSRLDCSHYIDLLAKKCIADAKALEDKGFVTDIIYETEALGENRPHVTIMPERLMAMLRGEEVLEVPVDAVIRFGNSSKKFNLNYVEAALFSKEVTEAYFQRLRKMVGEGQPIVAIATLDEKSLLEKYGMRLMDAKTHSGVNLDIAREEMGLSETSIQHAAPAPVAEVVVSSIQHDTHTETVTLITANNQTPYFVRRLLRDQVLLWSGTSYTAEGPWTEYHRDAARLHALNIHQ